MHYVLSRAAGSEADRAREMVIRGAEAVETYLREGLDKAMNAYNS